MKYKRTVLFPVLAVSLVLLLAACSTQPGGGGGGGTAFVSLSGTITMPAPQTGKLWAILLCTNSYSPSTAVTNFVGVTSGSATLSYSFTSLPKGNYVISAGVDVNNDYVIGNSGDYMTNYPGISIAIPVMANSVVDFPLQTIP